MPFLSILRIVKLWLLYYLYLEQLRKQWSYALKELLKRESWFILIFQEEQYVFGYKSFEREFCFEAVLKGKTGLCFSLLNTKIVPWESFRDFKRNWISIDEPHYFDVLNKIQSIFWTLSLTQQKWFSYQFETLQI